MKTFTSLSRRRFIRLRSTRSRTAHRSRCTTPQNERLNTYTLWPCSGVFLETHVLLCTSYKTQTLEFEFTNDFLARWFRLALETCVRGRSRRNYYECRWGIYAETQIIRARLKPIVFDRRARVSQNTTNHMSSVSLRTVCWFRRFHSGIRKRFRIYQDRLK